MTGWSAIEHSHWDWRNKIQSVKAGHHMLVAVEYEGEVQGIMAVLRGPATLPALRTSSRVRRLPGIGAPGISGCPRPCLGSWALVQFLSAPKPSASAWRWGSKAESGCTRSTGRGVLQGQCGMTEFGKDSGYFDLTYFEFTGQRATEWLAAIGGA